MRYHLLAQAPSGPLPCGPFEGTPPPIGERLTVTADGRKLDLEVIGHQHLPVVPGGTFVHDETWVICRLLR
jgi:hypothetical protein